MMAIIAFIILAFSAIMQITSLLSMKEDYISRYLVLLAGVLLLATTVSRSITINFIAVTNMFESLLFFSAVISIIIFFFKVNKFVMFGATMMALVFLAVASSPLAPSEIRPPIPALQSWWLILHVTFAFIGESFFVISFVSAIYYLATKDEDKKNSADRITYTATAIGYPIYTAGALIFGAIWAESAWGSFWSWDPKETWGLITWLTYTAYLHLRFIRRVDEKVSSLIQIVAFLFTLFTFLGVNFLLGGLHSY